MFRRKKLSQEAVVLTQIYGELNRIRLIMSEKSKIGQHILEQDGSGNEYTPFFDNESLFKKYPAIKTVKRSK